MNEGKRIRRMAACAGLFLLTWLWAVWNPGGAAVLWPSLLALVAVFLTRRVLFGLLLGALAGAVLLSGGNPVAAVLGFFPDHLFPSFQSSWKVGALLFTLLLGGFAALIERGGGLRTLMARVARGSGQAPARRFQFASMGLGLVCFFDGLANSMLIGRVTRSMADRIGVSRVRMAYLVDSTSSAVACVAFISTWIAFQLSLISQGLERVATPGRADPGPYALFFQSIPVNFYCLFTLVLLGVSIGSNFVIGPMRRFEEEARKEAAQDEPENPGLEPAAPVRSAAIPLAVLVGSIMAAFCLFFEFEMRPSAWDLRTVARAFSTSYGAEAMVLGCLAGIAAAWVLYPCAERTRPFLRWHVFLEGVGALVGPLFILMAAWMLGSVIAALDTAGFVSGMLADTLPFGLLPAAVFITGAIISFSTGTSWGTMGILMPLALPSVFILGDAADVDPEAIWGVLVLAIAAVFSGAVFGDHCSPFSDTTIISSIACGVEPQDHVRTQLPYAATAAGLALVFGFIPAGLGLPGWLCLLAGCGVLLALPKVRKSSVTF